MEINEIKALLSLLDDPDPEVQGEIRKRIVSEGRAFLPFLDEYVSEQEVDAEIEALIHDIFRDIQISGLKLEIDDWFAGGEHDLIKGAMIICRYEYPDLDETEVLSFISRIRQDVWLELNESLTAFEAIKVLNIVFFDEYGFSGNKDDYHKTENSFINKVIENKTGNPLLLSILYMSIAQQLEIPIKGVNLPNHFLVAYMDEHGTGTELALETSFEETEDILFYINPFSRGAILHRAEIDTFLKHLDLRPEPRFYTPCTHADMIRRMINNLIHAYRKSGDLDKADELGQFVNPVPTKADDI
jgi:regulator of sirC expression with transglutaminase-like and TPR domain